MILVDTSVWIGHLRTGEPALTATLDRMGVLGHVFVRGELACGNLYRRREILGLLDELPQAPVATDQEVLDLVERHSLMGRGLGYVDAHLLASALLAGARLWTLDARLTNVRTCEWMHTVGEVVTSVIAAGLRLRWLHEHDRVPWRMFELLVEDADGMFRWPDQPWLPLAFSLRAEKPG